MKEIANPIAGGTMQEGTSIVLKVKAAKLTIPLTITKEPDGKLWLKYPFSRAFNEVVKTHFEGYKWHGYDEGRERQQWSIKDCQHNWWQLSQLAYLADPTGCKSPYDPYDAPLKLLTQKDLTFKNWKLPNDPKTGKPFEIYGHQFEGVSAVVQYRRVLLAYEMGLGKTLIAMLAALKIQEMQGFPLTIMWAAPNSAMYSVQLIVQQWKFPIKIDFVPMSQLTKTVTTWPKGKRVWQMIVLDESSRYKSPVAKRSEAAQHIADNVRKEWGEDGVILEMTGSPAPKSPLDWFSQCRIAQPGFLKEPNIHVFKERLAFVVQKESAAGGVYPELLAWKDDPSRCGKCGAKQEDPTHDLVYAAEEWFHPFIPSVNEVAKIKDRTKGLVHVKFKKDCLDLPDKVYKEVICEPAANTLRAAEIILARATSTIVALTELRELSDGFKYTSEVIGKLTCDLCDGKGCIVQPVYCGPDTLDPELERRAKEDFGLEEICPEAFYQPHEYPEFWKDAEIACPKCDGTKQINQLRRKAEQVECPKEEALVDILEEYDDTRRMVIYAGFTGSIQRCVEICKRQQWQVISVIEGIWDNSLGLDKIESLERFQDRKDPTKIAFIGHPGSAGMGLTLTASQAITFYSNDYNGESRVQAEDRIHRAGMDTNRSPTIIDLIHLPTDRFVLKNLRAKRDLQHMTLTKELLYPRD